MVIIPSERHVPTFDPTKLRILLMGQPKCGKSTFCTMNAKAFILDTDSNGTDYLKCYRLPVANWNTFKEALGELAKPENKARFDTIVIDTVDMLWQRCREHVCTALGLGHESDDKGFGRSWDMVKTEFLKAMAFIAGQGWGVWMVTHTVDKEIKVGGVKRTVTVSTMPEGGRALISKMVDVIMYLDVGADGSRTLCVVPEDTLPVGDRTHHLTENITYRTPESGYASLLEKFQEDI